MLLEQIGTKGESLSLHTEGSTVEWKEGSLVGKKQPLTWYKVRETQGLMNFTCQSS